MKTQLLEDIGENSDRIPERIPALTASAAGAKAPAPAQPVAHTSLEAPAPAPARVWQSRAPVAAPEPAPAAPEPAASQPAYRQADALFARSAQFRPRAPASEPMPMPTPAAAAPIEPAIAPPVAAPVEANLQAPDILLEKPFVPREPIAPEPTLLERRSGQVGTWTAFALGLALLGGAAYWYDRESRIEDTMAIVANSRAPTHSAARANGAPVSAPTPAVREAPLPPMVMLQEQAPTQAAPAPANAEMPAAAPAPVAKAAAPAPLDKAPEPKRAPKKPVLAEREPAKPAAKPRRTPVAAKQAEQARAKPAKPRPKPAAPAPKPAAPPAEPKLTRDQRWEETLRLCRAAGYHATQCIERQCTATRYGLACRG